jgi:hypothetical protein
MSTTPSQVPVPSEKPQDLLFNAGKIDEEVTSTTSEYYVDRFGRNHLTNFGRNELARIAVASYGYITIDSFEDGATITLPNQVLRYQSTGEYYRWDGSFTSGGKIVPPSSTPSSTGGVGLGAWISVGDASLRANLKADEGSKLIGYGLNSVYNTLDQFLSVQKFMSPAEIADANSSNPVMDHSHAFVEAFAKSTSIYVPPVKGCYNVGDVEAPLGANIRGFSYKPYVTTANSDFYGCGSVIRKKLGAASPFRWSSRTTIEGLVFDGLDKLTSFMLRSSGTTALGNFRAIRCGFYRFFNAIGGNPGQYIGVQISDCQIASNFRGVYNSVDSMYIGCTINANDDDGINLQTGANDNTFISCRMEWNGGNNFVAVGALNTTIIGELNDRAGKAGIAVLNRSEVFVTGVRMRRNGKNAAVGSSDNTHFRLDGDGSVLVINGVTTKIGVDDGGGGQVSPQYSIYTGGLSINMKLIISGSDLSGSTGSGLFTATTPINIRAVGNYGIVDNSNSGFDRVINGTRFVYGLTKQISAPGQVLTIPLQQPSLVQASRYPSREIQIKARSTADGTDEIYSMKVAFSTESYGSRFVVLEEKSVPANRFGTTGAIVGVAIAGLSSDASGFNVVLTPTDSKNREISIFLI